MNYEHSLVTGVIFLYSLGTLGILLGTLSALRPLRYGSHMLTLAGFALHTALAFFTLSGPDLPGLSAGALMQLLAWCFILLYLLAWRWLRYPFLGLTAAPLALLLFVLSLRVTMVQHILPAHLSGLFFGLHIWSLYLSLGLLAMAFGAGLLFIYMEGKLKKKAGLGAFSADMPSLSACDKVNLVAVVAGFPLYTLGLMSGFIWAPMAASVVENPKVIISLFIWFLFALLFYQRTALGHRGRKPAITALAIFCVSALSFGIDYAVSHHGLQLLP